MVNSLRVENCIPLSGDGGQQNTRTGFQEDLRLSHSSPSLCLHIPASRSDPRSQGEWTSKELNSTNWIPSPCMARRLVVADLVWPDAGVPIPVMLPLYQ